jgi:hypothetical protein
MKNLLMLSAMLVFGYNCSVAQELSKEEKKALKEEIKSYLNDLSGYKAKMEDIRVTLDSNDAEIKRQKEDLAYAAAKQAETENKLIDYTKELERCHEQYEIIKNQPFRQGDTTLYPEGRPTSDGKYVTIAESTSPDRNNVSGNRGNEDQSQGTGTTRSGSSREGNAGVGSQTGTVYKIQLGLYQKFNINKYFEEPRLLGYEEENGMNRYIISDFDDEGVAMRFVDDIRRMGIKDAFVAKYINGVRVYEWSKNPKYKDQPVPSSLEEALEMEKKAKRGKKIN